MKRIASLILCALLLLSSAACGNNEANENGGNEAVGGNQDNAENSGEDKVKEHEGPWVVVTAHTNSYLYDKYIYDESGRITEMHGYNTRVSADEPVTIYTYTYTEQDDGSLRVRYGSDNEMCYAHEIIYSADGICLESYYYVGNPDSFEEVFAEKYCTQKSLYEYDAQKRVTKIDKYSFNYDYPSQNSNTVYNLTYDANGNLTKIDASRGGSFWKTITYTYNENGDMLTHDIQNVDDSWNSYSEYKSEYSYNYAGDLITKKAVIDERGGTVFSYTYDYDEENRLCCIKIKSAYDGMIPVDQFLGDGYTLENLFFSGIGGNVELMPLSLVLEQQNAQ